MTDRGRFFVSGGAGGIGAATCAALAASGLHPLVGFRTDAAAAERIANRCGGTAIRCDLTDEDSIAAAAALIEKNGDLAGIVLAASPPPLLAGFSRVSRDEFQAQWQINVAGPHSLLQKLVRNCLQPRKSGVVLGILSAAMGGEGRTPARGMSAYVVAKFGQAGLLSVLGVEYPWLKVRSISPGYVRTRMLDVFDERFLEAQALSTPIRRPEEVAQDIVAELTL
jgi:3-oxoacyl-[acyl-carrier protein] reductase